MRVTLCLLVSFWISATVDAQRRDLDIPRYEAGLQFDFNYLGGVGDAGGGFGARFHYNFDDHFALDSQLVYRQNDVAIPAGTTFGTGAIGQTTGLFGVRAGQRVDNIGFFVRARAGFLHFGTDNGATLVSRNTFPAFDLGATLERYSGAMIWRFELGEMVVPYGSATVLPGPYQVLRQPTALGTRASPSIGFGIAFRF